MSETIDRRKLLLGSGLGISGLTLFGNTAQAHTSVQHSSTQVHNYDELRALSPNDFDLGDIVMVTDEGIAGNFVLREHNSTVLFENGGTLIADGFEADGITPKKTGPWLSAKRWWVRIFDGPVNIKWFGAKGTGRNEDDDTLAFEKAIKFLGNKYSSAGALFLPGGTYRTTKTINVGPLVSIIGEGGSTIIQPRFDAWQSENHVAMRILSIDEEAQARREYNQVFSNFSINGRYAQYPETFTGSFNATAIEIKSAADELNVDDVVRFSQNFANYQDVLISQFDTALHIKECWNSDFTGITVRDCRRGIVIEGKSVNLNFNRINLSAFSKKYSNSSDDSIAFYTDSGFHYDKEGRPEGIVIGPGSLIYGADTNLYLNRCLFFRISDSIIDAAVKDCIIIATANNVSIKGCYIYTSNTNSSAIKLLPVNVSDSKINIEDNQFVGASTQYGIYSYHRRFGAVIKNNNFSNFQNPIYLNYFEGGKIKDNYGRGNHGELIYFQSGGQGSTIDGNVSDDKFPVLKLHPTTSAQVKIGTNSSKTTSTFFQGSASIASGASHFITQNNMYQQELYMRVITNAVSNNNVGTIFVEPQYSWSEARVNLENNATSETKISYTCSAIPLSAS